MPDLIPLSFNISESDSKINNVKVARREEVWQQRLVVVARVAATLSKVL